jgi:acetyl esterase/lipase
VRLAAFLLFSAVCFCSDPLHLISPSRLEAIHAQRIEWAKTRVVLPPQGIYQDYRAVSAEKPAATAAMVANAKAAGAQIVLLSPGSAAETRDGVLVMADRSVWVTLDGPEFKTPRQRKRLMAAFKQYPDEVFGIAGEINVGQHEDIGFRSMSAHYLARELSEAAVRDADEARRQYAAYDWLCDPTGFSFIAENNLGAFDIGDTVPMLSGTRLQVSVPVAAHLRIRNDLETVAEGNGHRLDYAVKEPGNYYVLAHLDAGGEEMLWIMSSPIHIGKPPSLDLPIGPISDTVEVHRGIAYIDDGVEKHKLDLFLPKSKTNFPVMVFLHGGSWRSGDRSTYALLGNRLAKAGIGVAIPSYRLMPRDPHPAQIEDAAAAFAWVFKNVAQYGGDVSRLYLTGHSAGGHLAALLALDDSYLSKRGVPAGAIHGVATMSGVYDVGELKEFQNADDDPSPLHHVHSQAPPFLITYCQWDYFGLPKQARDFATELTKKFVAARLVYVPGQNHISEMINTLKADDVTARALIDFIR